MSKPMIQAVDDLAEGVYMASGDGGSGCYTCTARIHQRPETGREDYRIQFDGRHDADHTNDHQVLTISFNQSVNYSWSNGTLRSGDGSNTLVIDYGYHQNAHDNIGLGDLIVTSADGLVITGCSLDDTGYQN